MRRFELSDGKSNKFWSVKRKGAVVTVSYGRIGTDGQTKDKAHADGDAAETAMEKLVASKTKKGYVEVGAEAANKSVSKAKKAAPKKSATKRVVPTESLLAASGARPKSSPVFDVAPLRKPIASWMRKEKPSTKYLRKPDDFVALLGKARESLGPKKDSGAPLDAAVEGAYGTLFYDYDTLLSWWLAKEGSAFMVRAFFERWRWDPWGHTHANFDDTYFLWVKKNPRSHLALRQLVARLGRKDYAAALKEAKAIRKRATLPMRCVIAFAFPDEPAFAVEDALAMMEDDEVATKVRNWWPIFAGELLASLRDAERIKALIGGIDASAASAFAAEMRDNLGDEAAVPLAQLLPRTKGKVRGSIASLLATLPSPEAAVALARHASDKQCRKALGEFAAAYPRLAAHALAATMNGGGKSADAAEQLLSALARNAPADVEAAAKTTSGNVETTLRASLAKAAPKKEAKRSAVPGVLLAPPWSRGDKPKVAPQVAGLVTCAVDETLVWDGERDGYGRPLPPATPDIDLESLERWDELPTGLKPRSAAMDKAVIKAFTKKRADYNELHFVASYLHQASDAVALCLWNETPPKGLSLYDSDVGYVLGRFGVEALPGVLRHVESNANLIKMASHVGSVRLAEKMADAHHRMKKARAHARRWMNRFPKHAAAGLLPLALSGESAKVREAACSALRFLGASHRKEVLAFATLYDNAKDGEETLAAATTLLDTDPLDIFPSKLKALPKWFDAAALSRPTIGGAQLPLDAVEHLTTMLSFSTIDDTYAGLNEAKRVCDADSLAAFAWGLFHQWLGSGAAGKEDWALLSLAHFGDDDIARRLAPLIRAWPGMSAHARAVKGLGVLSAIGSDIALMHLSGIANKIRFKGLQKKARERIDEIADARGLTREELADRLVPDLDLDEDGSRELSFGARAFRVGFDEALVPFVTDAEGKRRKSLPKPAKSDDAALAKESAAVWKNLKKDARTIAKQELWRLEHAMCAERTWDVQTFRTFLLEHPFVIHMVRRLLWGVQKKGKVVSTFMVDEERRLVDAKDDAFELCEDDVVTIPHPLLLKAKQMTAWGERLADYELLQPFAQLARDTYALEDSEVKTKSIVRFDGTVVATGKVLGLEKRGWIRGQPQDAGWIWELRKPLGGGLEANLGIGGGLLAGDMSESPSEQSLDSLQVRKEHTYDDAGLVSPHELSPVALSELIRDLESLREAV
ncbi:MAG: WGR and DUF4132 domain-containing protein [Polyangiales bacterium]